MAQLAEHVLGKDEVTSSNLVSSSIKYTAITVVCFCFKVKRRFNLPKAAKGYNYKKAKEKIYGRNYCIKTE